MPSRASVRTSRAAGAKPARSRVAATPDDVPDEGPMTSLRQRICSILGDVQKSNTGHRKLMIALRKVQEACCYEPADTSRQSATEDYDESDFNTEICRCLLRVLPVRKGEAVGDRIIRFLSLFLKHATDSDNAIFQEEDPDGAHTLPETPSSRLTSQLITLVLPLLPSKDKAVRFRCTQLVANLINTLDSVDDELFDHIRLGLLKRIRDKESSVRVQAVCGLGRLAGEGDAAQDAEDSDDDTAGGVLERLLDVLQNDPSAEVRRSLLLNLPFTPSTLPFLLERARDLDPSIRRALYGRLLPALGDFRHLSLTHREKLLRWGLRDRDENVRKSTGRLFRERWIEDCARPRDENGELADDLKPGQLAPPNFEGLTELLERIDVVNAGSDGGVALDAMKEFWDGRPDYADQVVFDEAFWKDLTPESVFVARTFNDYCRQEDTRESLQEKLPEVTRVAFLLQSNINALVALVQKIALQEDAEEDSVHQEFIVEQLLQVALTLDYSDEIGRRTMFSLMREALALAELPEEATKLVVEVLRMACGPNAAGEREFCGVVLEAIAEVHDTIMGEEEPPKEDGIDDSFHSARSELSGDSTPKRPQDAEEDEEKAIREIMVNMKCLHIAQCMLQNVECNLEDNVHLVTMLNNLVVPAVRSQEAPIRERGLLCLGLCCLIDKNLAEENLTLFLHCFSKGHEQLQTIAIQIIGDILAAHPSLLLSKISDDAEEADTEPEPTLQKPLHKMFSKALKSPSTAVQSTACAALSKLMLSAPATAPANSTTILNRDELLRLLVTAYFDPDTVNNPALRQSLSYFIPVFCHSRKENMQCMGRITLPVLHWYSTLKEEMDVDGEDEADSEMVSVSVVLAHLADWTDGRKLAMARRGALEVDMSAEGDADVHLEVAEQALEKLLGVSSREERKLHISLLGKLYFTAESNSEKMRTVSHLVDEAVEDKIAYDATTRNILLKVQTSLDKLIMARNAATDRDASPAPSVAPSSVEAAADAQTPVEEVEPTAADATTALSELNLQSTATTPAASPRKRSSNTARTSIEAEDDQILLSAATTPAASPTKSVRARRATVPRRQTQLPDDDDDQENVPPPEDEPASPTKRGRGRTKRAAAPADSEPAEPDAAPEFAIRLKQPDADTDANAAAVEEPVKKTRGRPARGAAAPAPAPARKSVRAGRKKASEEAE